MNTLTNENNDIIVYFIWIRYVHMQNIFIDKLNN